MSDARHALMSAIYDVLSGDAALSSTVVGVFDRVPRGVGYPFVAFGDATSAPLDGDAKPAVEHRFELTVHSRGAGRHEGSDVAGKVATLLDGASLAVAGHRLVGIRHRDTRVSASADRRAYRARVRFTALTVAN